MDIIASAKEYLKRILTSVPDMKILLLDPETIGILGMCFSKTEVMDHEVFLFDLIDKERAPMPHLKAVCFLRPTRANVEALAKEISEPKYSEYHVFFSNIITDSALRDLAEADEHDMVQQVHEYYVDYFPEYRSIFSLGLETMVTPSPEGLIGRICDGLSATLLSLKKKPMIRYQRNSEVCNRVATELGRRMAAERSLFEFPRTELTTTLLIIDRREDPVTPLLTQWTYQAMVHESFGLFLNRVDLRDVRKKKKKAKKGESSAAGPSEAKEKEEDNTLDEIVLSSEQDEFYRENMFSNWGQLGINVQRATAELQQKDASVRNMQSIDDMKEFMEKIPEYNKFKGTVAKHVTLMGDLLEFIQERRLYDVSALEQELACRDNQDLARQKVVDMLRSPSIHKENKIRLVMLYVLRYEKVDREYGQLYDLLTAGGCESEDVALIKTLLEYAGADVRGNDLYGNQKSFSDSIFEKVAGLKGVENIYTQHKPFVNRLIEDLVMGQFQMRENAYPILGGGQPKGNPRDLIIFFVGGATYEEVINAVKYATSPEPPFPQGIRIIVGGTCLHNSKSFMNEMRARYESTLRKFI